MQVKILAAIAAYTQFSAAKKTPYYELAESKDDIGWFRSTKYQALDRQTKLE